MPGSLAAPELRVVRSAAYAAQDFVLNKKPVKRTNASELTPMISAVLIVCLVGVIGCLYPG